MFFNDYISGGNLVRVEGNSVERPQYTLLFTDILLFAKITRDRVLFITEEPVALHCKERMTEFISSNKLHINYLYFFSNY